MRTLRLFSFVVLLCSMIGGAFFVPEIAQAADACPCFCTSASGAVDTEKSLTAANCSDECDARGSRVAAWACTANQYPSRSVNCFTSTQCGEHNGIWDKNYQPPECPTGMYYCYADPSNQESVTLSVAIGDLTSTKDIGEYASSIYIWLIGAMTTIAIVLLMVQGLRYSFGAMSASAVGAAKKKMLTIVIGLTLLLSTALIVRTINPQLLNLSVPSFPLIKTVSLVDNASCDELLAEGFEIDFSGPKACGTVGTVTAGPGGASVADGTVCNFSHCANNKAICVPGDTPTCMTCEELTVNNGVVQVSESICSAFNGLPEYAINNKSYDEQVDNPLAPGDPTKAITINKIVDIQECFFTRDPDAGGEVVGRGACALVSFECSTIKTCSAYDDITVLHGGGTTKLDNIELGENSGLSLGGNAEVIMSELGGVTMGEFCSADPCGWARSDNTKGCYVDNKSVGAITAGTAVDLVSALSVVSYDCETTPDTGGWFYTIMDNF